jgi:hypothetical protein
VWLWGYYKLAIEAGKSDFYGGVFECLIWGATAQVGQQGTIPTGLR